MDPNELTRLEVLFHALADIPKGSERDAAAFRLSEGDAELARRALDLVDSEEKAEAANQAARRAVAAPRMYGNYRTVRLLGTGGMGAVYLAERADGQFQQTVAVKVIAPHAAGEAFHERFLAERQILAGLNHPNITKLLDGGVTAEGTPYLVMEYVDGLPLDSYCDVHKLGLRSRLELFLKVCAPVAYAHRKLVVHRDLKPSNVLVTAGGQPMLLDFGTAKFLAGAESSASVTASMVTIRYSSPEQRSRAPITTSTDIFSLGVILYESLTGAWPFGDPSSPERMLERFARDTPMGAPSTAVTEEASAARSASLRSLKSSLEGDLRSVLTKALAPVPEDRYESAQAFAGDVESWLHGMPVTARPASFSYRSRKFLRRHWLAAAAGAVFVLGLTGSTVFAIGQANAAQAEARRAERVNQFLNGMLASPSKMDFDPKKFTVGEMLDAAEISLENSWKDDPLIESTIRTSLGSSYVALDRNAQAKSHLEKAAKTFQEMGRPIDQARAFMWLGVNTSNQGGDIPKASKYYHDALDLLRPLGNKAPPLLVFQTKFSLAYMESLLQQNPEEARRMIDEALALAVREPSISQSDVGRARSALGAILINSGKYTEAEAALRQSVEAFKRDRSRTAQRGDPLYLLVILYSRQGDFSAASQAARQYDELVRSIVAPDSAMVANGDLLWARYRADTGEIAPAIQQVLAAMPVVRRTYPPLSINLWTPLAAAVHVFNLAGRFPEAEAYAREELAVVDALPSPELDLRRAQTLWELGLALQGQSRNAEGSAILERSASIYEKFGPAWVKRGADVRKLKRVR